MNRPYDRPLKHPAMWAFALFGLAASWAGPSCAEMITRRWAAAEQGAQVLPAKGSKGVVRFELSSLPKGARIVRADLLIYRTRELTGRENDALVTIEIYPLQAPFVTGGTPRRLGRVLALREPWFDRFDATDAVRAWAGGRPNGGFWVKACPAWDPRRTALEVAYKGAPADVPPQATGLQVLHRSGQTFITWREIEDVVGKDIIKWRELRSIGRDVDRRREVRYCVYRSKWRITAGSLPRATRIATLKPLSCWNINGRNIEKPIDQVISTQNVFMTGQLNPFRKAKVDGPFGLDCEMERLAIRDGGPPLPRATGLYVHTAKERARAYYAVVTSVDGVQNTRDFSPENAVAAPVTETPGEPRPVLQQELPKMPLFNYPDRRLHYVRWVAPPYANLPYQYYNWSVAVPERLAGSIPLELNLHREGYSYYRTHYRIERDSIVLCPHDFPLVTWWYGYHESHGTLKSMRQGAIRNYTERRLLSFIDWAAKTWPVDRGRTLVTGVRWSGGSGALHLGLRHPEVFSLVLSGHGLPDYAGAIRDTQNTRRKGMLAPLERIWGKVAWGLKTANGKNIWDEMNLTKTIDALPARTELPLVTLTAQHYIAWGLWPTWKDFFQVMLEKRHSILAEFHWGGQKLLPVSATGTYPRAVRLDVRADRSRLAFKGPGAGVLDKAKGGMGGFNAGFRWRAGDRVDEADRYEVTIFWAGKGRRAQGNLTLRNLRKFKVEAGRTYRWEIRGLQGKTGTIQQGEVMVGDEALLTIERIKVSTDASRLIVAPR